MNDTNSLSHTKWNCKYHIVFAPKYRRKVFYKEKETRGRENTENTLRMEKDKNCGSRSMSRSCTYAGRNTAESSDIKLYGISEREKQPDDLRKVSGAEIQISESGILVQRILRGHNREKCKKIQEYIQNQLEEDKAGEQLTMGNF